MRPGRKEQGKRATLGPGALACFAAGFRMHGFLVIGLLVLGSPAPGLLAAEEDPVERGHAIAAEAERRADGFGDLSVIVKMTLLRGGREMAVRALRSQILERSDDGDRALVVFDEPADLRGTALLTWSHSQRDDDQWLFLPALKRVKRISSASRSGSFVGSEFSYEDLAPASLDAYNYRALESAVIDGADCWVIERRPRRASGYNRQTVWLDKQHYRVLRVDSYDRKDQLVKTLELAGYRLYAGRFWQPHRATMRHHKTGRSTVLEFSEYQLSQGLSPGDFDPDRLQDIR